MLLAIDVGNTRTKFGLFNHSAMAQIPQRLAECDCSLAVRNSDPIPWDLIHSWRSATSAGFSQTMLAGVDPMRISCLLDEWPAQGWPRPRVLSKAGDLPLEVRVDVPDGVGIDRLLSAVAVNALRPVLQSAVIVGAGTATTVDLVAADGAFEGGAILPGLELCSRALHQHTALLPLVPFDELQRCDLPSVGKNTAAAIRSGLLYGQVGAVRELIARFSQGLPASPLVVVTGGNGPLLAPHLGIQVRFERDLPLRGLALVAASTSRN